MKKNNARIPKQKRSIKLKEKILSTALHIFSNKGFHNTTTNEIAREADVSVGSFYSYFVDKKSCFLEVISRYLDMHFKATWGNPDRPLIGSTRMIIRKLLSNLVGAYDIAPDLHRESHALRYSDAEVKELYDAIREKQKKQIVDMINGLEGHVDIRNAEAAAMVIHNAAENVAHTIVFSGTSVDKELLLDELTNMIHRYIFSIGTKSS